MTTLLDDRVGQLAAAGRAQRLKAILRCPDCHGDLCWTATAVACPACGTAYPCGNERPEFAYPTADHTEDAAFQQERMHHRSLRGRMYDWGQRVITSEYAPHDHRAEFLAGLPAEAIAVEFGSGNRRLGEPDHQHRPVSIPQRRPHRRHRTRAHRRCIGRLRHPRQRDRARTESPCGCCRSAAYPEAWRQAAVHQPVSVPVSRLSRSLLQLHP